MAAGIEAFVAFCIVSSAHALPDFEPFLQLRPENVPNVDVTNLVAGFLIRIMYEAIVTEITISNWLYLTVMAFAFYFALGKRRNKLRQAVDGEIRPVLKAYPLKFPDALR